MKATRNYFDSKNFIEIDSPQLISANCIETHIDPISVQTDLGRGQLTQRYLHTSPEIFHKRLLSYGAQKIYQLSHVFRNGESGRLHLPEFSLLEWYRANGSLNDLIIDCENLFAEIAHALIGTTKISLSNNVHIDLSEPFERINMADLWLKYAQIDLRASLTEMELGNDLALVDKARQAGCHLRDGADFEDAFHHIMLTKIEPYIGNDRPTVVLRWPIQLAGLAKPCAGDPLFADRFEIYCDQMELANAFQELVDADEQLARFESDLRTRDLIKKNVLPINADFIADLRHMPDASGIAVGYDRLLMLLTKTAEINEVLPFPWIKS